MSEYHQSEQPAIELFKKMGYDYFDAKKAMSEVVQEDRLVLALRRLNPWLSDSNLQKVLRKVLTLQGDSLMSINQQLHILITKADALSLKPTPSEHPLAVKFMDFENIENNDFLVVNQMKFKGGGKNYVPDLVVFVNGLPLAVIEAKNQAISINEAISDLKYYQDNSPKLFWYNQFCVAINRIDGRYGAIDTPSDFYGKYNVEPTDKLLNLLEGEVTPQDILLYNLFEKERLLDIVRYFVVFELDEGKMIKKLPRYQQLRAVNKIVNRLKTEKRGGVVWHTQGSGKSITMSYMRQSLPHAKFIAFTGTPIDKKNKSTLHEFYGGDYIDKYTIKESVADGNTLPILYETGLDRLEEQGIHRFKSRVVMSFDTKKDPKEFAELATPSEEVADVIRDFKLPFGDEVEMRKSGKKQFDNTAFLIVSDMLLTGYDAPILQTLYVDKILKEHNLLQAIARVNRTRKDKYAGYVVDYVGITKHLIEALEIFSGDLEVRDVMVDIESEKSILENRHSKLVSYFKSIKRDRVKKRDDFLLGAVAYLEPENVRDRFRELLKDFNISMSIVLPNAFASQFDYDFKLFNELKLMVRDPKEGITREESRKLQMIIDEHLRANGIEYLLKEAIDITDYKKFKEELTKEGQHNPFDKAKAIIKANKEKNPELFLELSELLERTLQDSKIESQRQ